MSTGFSVVQGGTPHRRWPPDRSDANRPSRHRWVRYWRFYRRMGFGRLSAAYHAVRFAGTRPQVYRRGPPL